MQIELIGSTSAGKTTLARRMVSAGRSLGISAALSDDFVLRRLRVDWVGNSFLRRRLVEFAAFLVFLLVWPRYLPFIRVAWRVSFQCPGSLLYKLKVARIVLRKVGVYEIIRRTASADEVVIVDNEGLHQAAHTLFVHPGAALDLRHMAPLLAAAPLPEVAAYVRQTEAVLIERTLRRGHGRLHNYSRSHLEQFVRHAAELFERLLETPTLTSRLLVVDGAMNILASPPPAGGAPLSVAAELIRAGARSEMEAPRSTGESDGEADVHAEVAKPRNIQTGAVIAVVGPDATGKSTIVARLAKWLAHASPVSAIHAGKPPSSWWTMPLNAAFPFARRLLPQLRQSRSTYKTKSADSLFFALRAVGLAWDRRRLLRKARRRADGGYIVVCDRYPSDEPGAMDSPRLAISLPPGGTKARVLNALARWERRLYRRIPPPDVVLRLHVSPETAVLRNRRRRQADRDDEAYLEARPWSGAVARRAYDIDTEQELEQTIAAPSSALSTAPPGTGTPAGLPPARAASCDCSTSTAFAPPSLSWDGSPIASPG